MKSLCTLLIISTITLSLATTKPVVENPVAEQISTDSKTASVKKFLAAGAGLCFLGTYGALYLDARRSYTPISHPKIIIDALGYTGAGFSITAASYFAALLWSKSGLFQDNSN